MKSRNVRDAETPTLEAEEIRLEQKQKLTHGERDLLGTVQGELKRRRKTANRRNGVRELENANS